MSWMYALCCSRVFWSMQNRHVSCRPDQEERGEWEHISVAGCPSRRRDRLTSSLCRGLGRLPEEPQYAATAVGEITCSGHTQEDAQQTQTAHASQPLDTILRKATFLLWPGLMVCKAGDLWITLWSLEPASYFQTASLIPSQRTDKRRRWKGRLLLVSYLLGDVLHG